MRVGSVQVNSTSVGVLWSSEQAKLASLRPLHSDSSENVRCKVRRGDYGRKSHTSQSSVSSACSLKIKALLTGSRAGDSPGLSMMISFFRSSSMVLL